MVTSKIADELDGSGHNVVVRNGLACLIITCRVSTGYVVNPVRDQVNKENEYFPVPVSA